jgi:benzodiazapine receptor
MLACCSAPNEAPPQKLNFKNVLNILSYAANIALTYGVGNAGWLDTPDNGTLSDKYQTLVTPNSKAFSIWAVIFVVQAIFAIVQLFPRFRSTEMVQKGVGYWYFLVCAFQIGWTFTFAYEIIPASLVCMLLLWLSLMGLLYSQYYSKSDNTLWEFWLLRFPFAIHGGWITAASALNVNVQVVSMKVPADIQLAVAIVSLAVLHAISVWVLFNIPRPNWTIACVLSWAFGWIYYELQDPNELIVDTFVTDIISAVAYAAFAVGAVIIPAQILVRLILLARPTWNPYRCNSAAVEDDGVVVEEENKEEELKAVNVYGDEKKEDEVDVIAGSEQA